MSERETNWTWEGSSDVASAAVGEAVAYSLTNSAGGAFAIDSSSGVVTVADSSKLVDLGATASITVRAAEADDGGGAVRSDERRVGNEGSANGITDTDSAGNTES